MDGFGRAKKAIDKILMTQKMYHTILRAIMKSNPIASVEPVSRVGVMVCAAGSAEVISMVSFILKQ